MTMHGRVVICPSCGHEFTPTGIDPEWADGVRARRIAAGVSTNKLANALGFSTPYICDIELKRRNKPRPEIVTRWESFLTESEATR